MPKKRKTGPYQEKEMQWTWSTHLSLKRTLEASSILHEMFNSNNGALLCIDDDMKPAIGFIHGVMDRAMKHIKANLNHVKTRYQRVENH